LTIQKGYAEQLVEQANAVLVTFGSYRLGVSASIFFSLSFISSKFSCH
jgi:poly(A) polymerase Pap1